MLYKYILDRMMMKISERKGMVKMKKSVKNAKQMFVFTNVQDVTLEHVPYHVVWHINDGRVAPGNVTVQHFYHYVV